MKILPLLDAAIGSRGGKFHYTKSGKRRYGIKGAPKAPVRRLPEALQRLAATVENAVYHAVRHGDKGAALSHSAKHAAWLYSAYDRHLPSAISHLERIVDSTLPALEAARARGDASHDMIAGGAWLAAICQGAQAVWHERALPAQGASLRRLDAICKRVAHVAG